MLNVLRTVAPVSSLTSTVKEYVPAVDGVPETRASGRFSKVFLTNCVPGGTDPETSLNLNVEGPGGSSTTMEAR